MKNVKMNSCLADFENELESLNHSEMKELVGGNITYSSLSGGGGACSLPGPSVVPVNTAANSYMNYLSSYPSGVPNSTGSFASHGGGGGSGSISKTPKDDKDPATPQEEVLWYRRPNYIF